MRKRTIKIGLFMILFSIFTLPLCVQIRDSIVEQMNTVAVRSNDQTEICIANETSSTYINDLGFTNTYLVFEQKNQFNYSYRIQFILNYSILHSYEPNEMEFPQQTTYVWYYANQVFLHYQIDNVYIEKNQSYVSIRNYSFSTPNPIDGFRYSGNLQEVGTLFFHFERSDYPSGTIYVPNLNHFFYNLTVITDILSIRMQKEVIWPNTSIAALLGFWTTTVLSFDDQFEHNISEFTGVSTQMFCEPGLCAGFPIYLDLNKTSSTTNTSVQFMFERENGHFMRHETPSMLNKSGWVLDTGEDITYHEHFTIEYSKNSTFPFGIYINFEVVQQKSTEQTENKDINPDIYTAIYVTVAFVGGIGVTILGGIIWKTFQKKRMKQVEIHPT